MKIYNFEEFVKLPAGTLYYMDWNMRVKSFFLKHDSIIDGDYRDFYFTELITHKKLNKDMVAVILMTNLRYWARRTYYITKI